MEEQESIKHKLLGYGVKAVLISGTAYGLYRLYEHYNKSHTERAVEKKVEVRQAMIIYSAMNPSGAEWLKKADGTNTQAIFDVAKEIVDLKKVQDAYTAQYHSELLDDLRQELSPEDYTKFLNTLKFSSTNVNSQTNTATNPFKRGTLIATKLKANLRKTPKNISHWSMNSNIIRLAEAGKYLGFATGKSEFDNSGESETGTLFIEIQAVALDTRKAIYYWVASSQLQAISLADYKARKYPFLFLNENEVLQGLEQTHKRVIAMSSVPVLNEQFQLIGFASPLQQLGYSIMELNDNKGNEYVKFMSDGNKLHWVNKKLVHII